jgi:uncharacterized damage-inducible protein DinB
MKTKNFTNPVLCLAASVLIFISCNKPAPTTEAVAPSTDRINQMVNDWERAKKFTKAYLDSANDKTIAFKLSDKTPRAFGDQLLHLAEANYGLGQAATGKPTDMGFGKLEKNAAYVTKADVTKAVMDSYDYVIGALKEMNDGQLADTCSVTLGPGFKPTMSKELMLNKAFEHQTHHRGQATQYLRAHGLTPPQEMLF